MEFSIELKTTPPSCVNHKEGSFFLSWKYTLIILQTDVGPSQSKQRGANSIIYISSSGKVVKTKGEERPFIQSSGTLMKPENSSVLRVLSLQYFLKIK
jgi:hypothetical protein